MDDLTSFPRYQYSVFTKNGRESQVVIRNNNKEKFIEDKKWLEESLGRIEPSQTKELTSEPVATLSCLTCGADAVKKTGKKKDGSDWSGIFCQVDSAHVKWL